MRPGRNGGWIWGTVVWIRRDEVMVDEWMRVVDQ